MILSLLTVLLGWILTRNLSKNWSRNLGMDFLIIVAISVIIKKYNDQVLGEAMWLSDASIYSRRINTAAPREYLHVAHYSKDSNIGNTCLAKSTNLSFLDVLIYWLFEMKILPIIHNMWTFDTCRFLWLQGFCEDYFEAIYWW